VLKSIVDLIVRIAGLEGNLLARKVRIEKESLDTESLIACKIWALLL
jgi:hypothetical protein